MELVQHFNFFFVRISLDLWPIKILREKDKMFTLYKNLILRLMLNTNLSLDNLRNDRKVSQHYISLFKIRCYYRICQSSETQTEKHQTYRINGV